MPKVSTAQGISFGAPIKGVNFKDALASMDPAYTPWAVNVCAETQYTRLRNAMIRWSYFVDNTNDKQVLTAGVYPGATDKIYVLSLDNTDYKIYDFTSSGAVSSSVTTANYFSGQNVFTNFFNKNLFYFDNAAGSGVRYDGTSWVQINYTYSVVGFHPAGAANYKGRQYIIDNTALRYEYTDIQALQGNTHGIDLSTVFSTGTKMSWVTTFSSQDGVVNSQYIAFCNDAGEVLIFNGDYPDSTSTWQIVARFKVGKSPGVFPYTFSQVIDYQGDALIITSTGVVSLKDLISEGSAAAINLTVSSYIDAYWSNLVTAQRNASIAGAWSGVFSPQTKKIIILTQGALDKNNTFDPLQTTAFVFNVITGSWSIYQSSGVRPLLQKIINANNTTYFTSTVVSNAIGNAIYIFEPAGSYLDNSNTDGTSPSYDFEIDSAWMAIGGQIVSKSVSALETFVYTKFSLSDPALYLYTKLSCDFGRQTTATSSVYQAGAGFMKLSYNVGIEGVFFQSQIIGLSGGFFVNPQSLGYNLYSQNIIFEPGGPLS